MSDESTVEIGGQVMTQAQYDAARFPLIAKRDRLREVVDAAAVVLTLLDATPGARLSKHRDVVALRALVRPLDHVYEPGGPNGDCHICTLGPDEHSQLDVSPVPGGPSVGDRATCRWCRQPITFTSSADLLVDEDSWAHDGPQPGSGYVRRRKCEADMQSMAAEPKP